MLLTHGFGLGTTSVDLSQPIAVPGGSDYGGLPVSPLVTANTGTNAPGNTSSQSINPLTINPPMATGFGLWPALVLGIAGLIFFGIFD